MPTASARLRRKLDLAAPAFAAPGQLLLDDPDARELTPRFLAAGSYVTLTMVPLMEAALRRARELAAEDAVRAIHASGDKLPGFGHPVHRPLDPRAERILELADARGVSGPHVLLARCMRDSAAAAWGKPLTMNVSMPIAAVMLDLGFPATAVKAVPILARTAGLLAHLAEEGEEPIGFALARAAEEAVEYER